MKTILYFVLGVCFLISCNRSDNVLPQEGDSGKNHSGARPIGSTPGVEYWGGITLQRYPVSGPTIQYYAVNWAGVTLKFDPDFSFMNGPANGQPAYSTIINNAELVSSAVNVNSQPQLGSTGFFELLQLNTGPSDSYGPGPRRRAIESVQEAVAGIYAQSSWYFGYYRSGDMKDAVVDAIEDLKKNRSVSDPAQAQEIDNIKNNVMSDTPQNSSVQSDMYSYTITGRLVVKPGGGFGVVPVGWIPPVLPEP